MAVSRLIAVTACPRYADYSGPCGWADQAPNEHIDELLAEGDLEGRAVRYRILEAVKELERTKPTEGECVN